MGVEAQGREGQPASLLCCVDNASPREGQSRGQERPEGSLWAAFGLGYRRLLPTVTGVGVSRCVCLSASGRPKTPRDEAPFKVLSLLLSKSSRSSFNGRFTIQTHPTSSPAFLG